MTGQYDTSSYAGKEFHPQLGFERLDLLADGAVRQKQRIGGLAKALMSGGCFEYLKISQGRQSHIGRITRGGRWIDNSDAITTRLFLSSRDGLKLAVFSGDFIVEESTWILKRATTVAYFSLSRQLQRH
nr:hypothetical protein [Burkholderia gladioli]